jgi:predicted ribosomally synthesized peptide with SipW-like signal peptide
MTNRKTTKRALLGSVLALVLCFAMLLGSTYAWFTDTDSVDVAVIKSGTLDMEFSVDQDGWTTSPKALFALEDNEWWEPGFTQVEYFKVANIGNLALQWQARISVPDGVTLDSNLAANINVYVATVAKDATEKAATRNDIVNTWTSAGTLATFVANTQATTSTIEGILAPVDDSSVAADKSNTFSEQYFAIALVMNKDAGNECQNKVLLPAGQTMNLTIVATQTTMEKDDFGTDYDTITIDNMAIADFHKYSQNANTNGNP